MVHHVQTPFFMRAILLYGTAKLALFFFSCKLFANFLPCFYLFLHKSIYSPFLSLLLVKLIFSAISLRATHSERLM